MKYSGFILTAIWSVFFWHLSQGQNDSVIHISDKLILTKLTAHTYIHTSDNNNGIIYLVGKEAAIVSTPADDTLTVQLIQWVQNVLKADVKAYIIDRWHPDAMEGLDVVEKFGIRSYANKRTVKIAEKKNLPLADIKFNRTLTLDISGKKLICKYLGPALHPMELWYGSPMKKYCLEVTESGIITDGSGI